jgi:hypothetical protein
LKRTPERSNSQNRNDSRLEPTGFGCQFFPSFEQLGLTELIRSRGCSGHYVRDPESIL